MLADGTANHLDTRDRYTAADGFSFRDLAMYRRIISVIAEGDALSAMNYFALIIKMSGRKQRR